MMNAVVQVELHICDRWKLKHATKINNFSQLLAVQFSKPGKISFKRLRVPLRDPRGVAHGIRPVLRREIKLSSRNAIHESVFGSNDMPGQFEPGLGNGIGSVVSPISRNSLDDLLGDAMLIFQGGQRKRVEEYGGLLRLQCFHHLVPPNSSGLYSIEKIAVRPLSALSKPLPPSRVN